MSKDYKTQKETLSATSVVSYIKAYGCLEAIGYVHCKQIITVLHKFHRQWSQTVWPWPVLILKESKKMFTNQFDCY